MKPADTSSAERTSIERFSDLPFLREEGAWPGDDGLRLGWTLAQPDQPDRTLAEISAAAGESFDLTPVYLNQVHGVRILPLWQNRALPEGKILADGMLTDRSDLVLGIAVADCLPIFIRAGLRFGVLHAGWRGVLAGILPAAIEKLAPSAGPAAESVECILGPGIGPCCFQVSAAVWALFDRPHRRKHGDCLSIDLPGVVFDQWLRSGAKAQQLWRWDRCTACGFPQLQSFRRDRGLGRNYAYIYRI